jgi:hypothetical protein
MCITIELVVPPASNDDAVSAALLKRMPFWTERIGKSPTGDVILAVMAAGGRCQCTTTLGTAQPARRPHAGNEDRKIAAMRRQGWSESRIERWLTEKQRTQTKDERVFHARADGVTAADVDDWRAFIEDVVRTRLLDRIGVHVGYGLEEAIERQPIVIPLHELNAPLLRSMGRESLYVFVLN